MPTTPIGGAALVITGAGSAPAACQPPVSATIAIETVTTSARSRSRGSLRWAHASNHASQDGGLRRVEPGDVPPLPRRLHGPSVVVPSDVGDRLARGYAVDHGQAGQCRARATTATVAGQLDPLLHASFPHVDEGGPRRQSIGRETEVGPLQPPVRPRCRRGCPTEEVQPELGNQTLGKWRSQSSTADDATTGEDQRPRIRRAPPTGHRAATASRVSAAGSRAGAPTSHRCPAISPGWSPRAVAPRCAR